MIDENNSGIKTTEMLTRNIAKSGEVLIWSGFSPFQLHLGLIVNRSLSASCHIANGPTIEIQLLTKTKKRNVVSHIMKLVFIFVSEKT
jgi:hypothetical protein